PKVMVDELSMLGHDTLSNDAAQQNLARMGATKTSTAAYVHAGMQVPALRTLVPGVQIDILGPPTIDQKSDLARQRSQQPGSEQSHAFWRQAYTEFTRFWQVRAETAALAPIFSNADTLTLDTIPIEDRWFVRRLRTIRGRQLLGLARAMDRAVNNTSVI